MHASFAKDAYAPDNLIAGNADLLISRKVTIPSGQTNLKRGALMGKITTGGKYILSLSAAADGSQTPDAVLAHDVGSTTADTEALVYVRGDFQAGAMTFGTAHTAATVREGLRAKGINLIDTFGA